MYRFIKTVGDKAFTFIKKISKAVNKKTKKKVEKTVEPVKTSFKSDVLFDNGSLSVKKVTVNDAIYLDVNGTVKEFLRKFPKEQRVPDIKMFFHNKSGTKTYQFIGKTSEKVFKQID